MAREDRRCWPLVVASTDPPDVETTGRWLAGGQSVICRDEEASRGVRVAQNAAAGGTSPTTARWSARHGTVLTADAYRQLAIEAQQLVARATDPIMKAGFERVAQHWLALADRALFA